MKEKVFVVFGYNGILKSSGPVGVARTRKGAEKILKDHEYMLDDHKIIETELEA